MHSKMYFFEFTYPICLFAEARRDNCKFLKKLIVNHGLCYPKYAIITVTIFKYKY